MAGAVYVAVVLQYSSEDELELELDDVEEGDSLPAGGVGGGPVIGGRIGAGFGVFNPTTLTSRSSHPKSASQNAKPQPQSI